jgi:hypothetical protein
MFKHGKTARILAITLSVFGAASVAYAGGAKKDDGGGGVGGFVIPGSTVGVNPAHHPEYFGSLPNYACFARFSTYDAGTDTYLDSDGHRHPCRRR